MNNKINDGNLFQRLVFEPRPEPFWSEILTLRFGAIVCAVMIIANVLSHFWVFEYPGLFANEVLNRWKAARTPTHVEVVEITSEDLKNKFEGELPLSPAGMTKVLDKILAQNPEVVGHDLETSAEEYRNIPTRLADDHRIVWARPGFPERFEWRTAVHPLPVLGQRDQEPPFSGLALFPTDRDWTVRSYANCIEMTDGTHQPSFILAILQAYDHRQTSDCESGEIVLNALDENYSFHAISLAELSRYGTDEFRGKIVILGGAYSYHDRHPTAFGVSNGAELVASALEAHLSLSKDSASPFWFQDVRQIGFEIGLALLIVLIHSRLRPIAALVTTTLLLSIFLLLGLSLAALLSGYSQEFVPFLAGIWIEQLVESSIRAEGRTRELEELKARLGRSDEPPGPAPSPAGALT